MWATATAAPQAPPKPLPQHKQHALPIECARPRQAHQRPHLLLPQSLLRLSCSKARRCQFLFNLCLNSLLLQRLLLLLLTLCSLLHARRQGCLDECWKTVLVDHQLPRRHFTLSPYQPRVLNTCWCCVPWHVPDGTRVTDHETRSMPSWLC